LIEGLQRWLSDRHWQNRRRSVESLLSDVSLMLPSHTSSSLSAMSSAMPYHTSSSLSAMSSAMPSHTSSSLSDVSLVRRLSDVHLN
jgi:hypothetical protein